MNAIPSFIFLFFSNIYLFFQNHLNGSITLWLLYLVFWNICCPGGNVRLMCGYVEKLHSLKCVGCSNVFYDSKLTVSVFGLCE